MGGSTTVVSGASGATVSVMDSPVVISDVVIGPGGAGSGCSAKLAELRITPSAPMVTSAPAPIPAETIFTRDDVTFDHSNSGLVRPFALTAEGRSVSFEEVAVDLFVNRVTERAADETRVTVCSL